MNDIEQLRAIGEWLGTPWTLEQEGLLLAYAEYLSTDGVTGGGLGPHEIPRMIDRHVGDGLAYLSAMSNDAGSVIDIGSGVGIPGIPLAIARPGSEVVLLDRSQRRCDLAGRAVRILGIDNVEVRRGDASDVLGHWDTVVFRASLGISDAAQVVLRLTKRGGLGVFGVSRLQGVPEIPEPPMGLAFDLRKEADEVLDSPSWLLRMSHL